jgi:3-deoxy-D-manno-octulosonate 8-phosphate phosphatase (KDO 8-P phosphatase)
MVLRTESSTGAPYIVVLDVASDAVRALLFDSEARRVEGYAAMLPNRPDAATDCLDEMHRLVEADGFKIGAVVGQSDGELTPEDLASWPAFAGAQWFPALPDGAGAILGSGCTGTDKFVVVAGEGSRIATLVNGLEARSVAVPEAYALLRVVKKKSLEAYLESADHLAALDSVAGHFRDAFFELSSAVGRPREVIGCGSALLISASLSQRIADALGLPLTLSTEPEPAGRGAALWALERIGAIGGMSALAASAGHVFTSTFSEPTNMNHELLERASRIRMLLMDVDGVLTNAKLYNVPGPDGTFWETKGFDAQDGIALQWMSWYGIETGVISGRVSPAVEERARQVKMTHVYQGHIEKIPILQEICEKSGIPADAIAYIGDDLTDVVVMRRVLLGIAPSNARPEVKKAAHLVTQAAGGNGAVREVCELLLQAQGKWPEILKKYEIE